MPNERAKQAMQEAAAIRHANRRRGGVRMSEPDFITRSRTDFAFSGC
jgi:hypothetical protein